MVHLFCLFWIGLRTTIRDTDIPGSPFTVNALLPSVVKHTITGLNRPHGVAVNKSGEVVVSETYGCCISVYSREEKKIRSFGSFESSIGQFQFPCGVAINSDNDIFVADAYNHRIHMFTKEGSFMKSVGQKGQEPLQFAFPSGIAIHPSGRVFVADTENCRIHAST